MALLAPSSSSMLRMCSTVLLRNPKYVHTTIARSLFIVRSFTTDASSSVPVSPSTSSFGLSLESLEAYANKLSERRREQRRSPVKRKSNKRAQAQPESKSFDSLPISTLVKERLCQLGLLIPTDVQNAAIPLLLQVEDAAIQSYTGSGKTLAYLLPILSKVGPLKHKDVEETVAVVSKRVGIEAVVVAPSRELAMQIVREAERILGPEHKKTVQQLVGGASRARQEEALKKNKPLIIVGTPGRISEVSRDGKLQTHNCRFLILDEADELLSVQFREDMRRILEHVGRRKASPKQVTTVSGSIANPDLELNSSEEVKVDGVKSINHSKPDSEDQINPTFLAKEVTMKSNLNQNQDKREANRIERQTVLVSATMPAAVLRAAADWGQKPVLVKGKVIMDVENVTRSSGPLQATPAADAKGVKESLPPSISHYYAVSKPQHKVDTARKCINAVGAKSAIIFMNHPQRLKDTVFKLEARGIIAAPLHGELSKLERTNTLGAFRKGKIHVLVTSEVGARGIDVPDCDLVINLELPTDIVHYAHRAGRTGRIGRKGTVVSICMENETFVMKKFQKQLSIQIEECEFVRGGLISSKDSEKTLVKA